VSNPTRLDGNGDHQHGHRDPANVTEGAVAVVRASHWAGKRTA
jgi:hypothetical protein